MVKISVIIPVCNTEKYLRECLDSVLNQTLKDIEIICIDEGLSDASLDILKDYVKKDQRNKIISKKNKDMDKSNCIGIKNIKGKYICYVDDKDCLELNTLEKLYKNASNESDIILFNLKDKDTKIKFLPIKNINLLKKHDNLSKVILIFDVINEVEYFLKKNNCFDTFNLNFLKFKIEKIRKTNANLPDELKNEFFKLMKKEFLKTEISPENLKKLPTLLSNWYINTINLDSYDELATFQYMTNNKIKFIDKNELDFKIKNFKEIGINNKEREEKFIISLTSFPERMHDIHYCLYSLLTQTLKPDKIILWLAEEEFPNKERDIPKEVLNLKKNGLSIEWCKNLKSYKKLIPTLKKYPNYCIITSDDDIFYPSNWLEELYEEHLNYPTNIIAKRCKKMDINKEYNDWELITKESNPSYLNFPTGVGGNLFPPKSVNNLILEEKLFKKLCPTGDDIWFWAMMVLNKTKIKVSKNPLYDPTSINPLRDFGISNETTLWNINKLGTNDIQLNNILNEFPEILDILNEENERK